MDLIKTSDAATEDAAVQYTQIPLDTQAVVILQLFMLKR